MNRLRRVGVGLMLNDHQSKPSAGQSYDAKRAFGSGYKGHLARSIMQIELITSIPGQVSSILRQTKNNFAARAGLLPYHMHFKTGEQGSIEFEAGTLRDEAFIGSASVPADVRVENYLRTAGISSKKDIIDGTGIHHRTVDNALLKLRSKAKLIQTASPEDNRIQLYPVDETRL
jgi:hypothetical protein